MKIDVVLTPDTVEQFRNRKSVVVIDVFRASTTIITALANGAESVIPLRTPKEARDLKSSFSNGNALLCGERKGICIDGFDFGNSPREYSRENVQGKILLFTSTNGSQMITKAKVWGEIIFIAGFVNHSAVFQ